MFFLTEQDPNYRIKGSRDPLGFQPIWQSLGRTVVKYLSTVSVNLKDFQILSYAWYFYQDKDPKDFLKFFTKFEQAFGFARGLYLKNDRFNGIDFVRKNLNKNTFYFSNKSEHTLLSNQKSYGIYGKYNRPYTEMKIKEHINFRTIMETSLRNKVDYPLLEQYVNRLYSENISEFTKQELEVFSDCVKMISEDEKEFYKELILENGDGHIQNEVFKIFESKPELIEKMDKFNLYGAIDVLIANTTSEELKLNLLKIRNAEQVLMPYSFLFRTLQSKPTWTFEEIETAPIFNSFPTRIAYHFNHTVLDNFNNCFQDNSVNKALAVIERNKKISENRKNAAWIKYERNTIITCYADGGRIINEFDKNVSFENNYFLPTYISLYKQIMLSNV
ncbi:hypothetical protein [Polaribacter atrinae]|uniref:hypothetical protein n=1 Tax=Polaribacter atrinae TaxID=1333662 RepID=UPI0030F89414